MSRPRQRFIEKARRAGFATHEQIRHRDLVHYAIDTLALVEPGKAYAFQQVIGNDCQIIDVAAAMELSERQVRRYLEGHEADLGAEDWFLIILELYREADFVGRFGAEVLWSCFHATASDNRPWLAGPFHHGFLETILESLTGGPVAELAASLPWKHPEAQPVLAWPCQASPPPLPRSYLPGVIAVMRRNTSQEELLRLCLLFLLLATSDGLADDDWTGLLSLLNHGGPSLVARHGRIPETVVEGATERARLLISGQRVDVRHGLLGVLARTPLPWAILANSASGTDLASLAPPEDVEHCFRRFIRGV